MSFAWIWTAKKPSEFSIIARRILKILKSIKKTVRQGKGNPLKKVYRVDLTRLNFNDKTRVSTAYEMMAQAIATFENTKSKLDLEPELTASAGYPVSAGKAGTFKVMTLLTVNHLAVLNFRKCLNLRKNCYNPIDP